MALIDATVIISDVNNLNGNILQILTPIPCQTALKWSIQFYWSVAIILVYLGERESKQACIKYIHTQSTQV